MATSTIKVTSAQEIITVLNDATILEATGKAMIAAGISMKISAKTPAEVVEANNTIADGEVKLLLAATLN